MTEVSRPRGRPPKVRPEAAPALTEQEESTVVTVSADPVGIAFTKPPPAVERLIEVQLMRKYAPGGQAQEIQRTVPSGTVMKLPQAEATRALKLGIARATDHTFG